MRKDSGRLIVNAPGKVNLFLEILGEQGGFHRIVTVMQTISLCDSLEIESAPEGQLELSVEGPFRVPVEDNLVLRAARLLWSFSNVRGGARISLVKRIPVGAGLGGGSSDAAGALLGLNSLWNLALSAPRLLACAAALGSDVPFFIHGGCSLCTGRGESVHPLKPVELDLVLVMPKVHVSTAVVYRNARHEGPKTPEGPMLKALEAGDREKVKKCLFNRLQETTVQIAPEVKCALDALREERLSDVLQSGSGGAVFGLAGSAEDSRLIAGNLAERGFHALSLKSPTCRGPGVGECDNGNHWHKG